MCGIKTPEAFAWPTNKNDNNNTGLPSPHQTVWSLMNLVWLHMNWICDLSFGLCWLQMSPGSIILLAGGSVCLPHTHTHTHIHTHTHTHIHANYLWVCMCVHYNLLVLADRKVHPFALRCRALKRSHTHTFQQQPLSPRSETRAALWSSQAAGVQFRCIPIE